MKEIQTAKGVLKYRDPDALDVMDMLEASGIYTGETNPRIMQRNIMAVMGKLIDASGIEGNPSYQELLKDTDEMMIPLNTISDDILLKAFNCFKKKHSLGTQSL